MIDCKNVMNNLNRRIYGKYIVTNILKINNDYQFSISCLCGKYNTVCMLSDLINKGAKILRHLKCVPKLSGQIYNYLTVLSCLTPNITNSHDRIWECKCKCGKIIHVHEHDFLTNNTTSCGCYQKHLNSVRLTKHGLSDTRIHVIWKNMKSRCYNKSHPEYNRYGGRGIYVCDEWRDNSSAFIEWSLKNGYSDNLTIDRINNNYGYSPENCRWVDYKTQQSNRSTNVRVCINNEWYTVSQYARKHNIKPSILFKRIMRYKLRHKNENINEYITKLI